MNDWIGILVVTVIAAVAFAWAWNAGHLKRFADYVQQTREELRKCSWPSWDELKGSTLLVAVCIIILGGFTVAVDQIFFRLFMLFKI
jgi:preprotein translocase subunit SecE